MGSALHGKVAIVTGASRGIGKATAIELARLGASVAVVARTTTARRALPGTVGDTVAAIEALGGQALAVPADLFDPEAVESVIPTVLDRFGRLDILVNNAADTGKSVFETIWDATPESWRRSMELNVNVVWVLTRRAAEVMRECGGVVVNIASGAGAPKESVPDRGEPGWLGAVYPTSKAAVIQMTRFLGAELRSEAIGVIGFEPGFTAVEATQLFAGDYGVDLSEAHPAEDVARAIGQIVTSPRVHERVGDTVWFDEFDPSDWQ